MWYQKVYPSFSTSTGYSRKSGYVQVKGKKSVYTGASDYTREVGSASGDYLYQAEYYANFIDRGISGNGFKDPWFANKLRNKFIERLQSGNSAQLLTSLVEVGQSYDMIARRALTLRRAFVALRRFDLPRVAAELALPRDVQRNVERRVSKKHYVTQNWLEYWMGWAPMIGDIQSALKVIESPPRSQRILVSVRREIPSQVGSAYLTEPKYARYCKWTIHDRASFCARVQLINPQLALASQLGLTNPFSTAWEVIPFSFIVNWFVNVDSVLQSSSPFYGYRVFDSSGTLKSEARASMLNSEMTVVSGYWVWITRKQDFNAVGFWRRTMPVPSPKLQFELPNRLSLTRAATSISLLTQLFLKP